MPLPGMTQLNNGPAAGPLTDADFEPSFAPSAAHASSEFLEDLLAEAEPGDGIQRGLFGWPLLIVATVAAVLTARCAGLVG
jgi:hypothetical protein